VRNTILGISAFYHDSAAALLINGEIAAAAHEERFTRKKHDSSFPINAVRYVLQEAGVDYKDLTAVAFYDKPFLKFERLLETYHGFSPRGLVSFQSAIPVWIKEKLFMKRLLKEQLGTLGDGKVPIYYPEHHLSHAASAFYPSPFEEAAIVTIDGVGEWATTTIGYGQGNKITLLKELHFPHSIGLLYSAFTYYTGFVVNSGEYKLMGLAPYGNPESPRLKDFVWKIKTDLVDIREDGSILLNMDYFSYATGLRMVFEDKWEQLFGVPRRRAESDISQVYMDMALAIQQVTEEIVMRLCQTAARLTKSKYLVLAGGVALNCVANGKLLRSGMFEDIWIQPAAGDAGGALGAAYAVWYIREGNRRILNCHPDAMHGAYLGPSFSDREIERILGSYGAVSSYYDSFDELAKLVATRLAEGKVIGWFQGRMEYGPRALGNRSILGDSRNPEMQKKLNLKIKYREGFRPFAPSVLEEDIQTYFELDRPSPYMLLVAPVRAEKRIPAPNGYYEKGLYERLYFLRSDIPSITHIDYSARIQSVSKDVNPRYWQLIREFKTLTGYGLIVNTSFNLSTEPIVCTPQEAYHTFMQSEMDLLVLENFVLQKDEQPVGFRAWTDEGASEPDPDSPYADPRTGDPLIVTATGALNPATGTRYEVEDGVPRLFLPTEDKELDGANVTDIVRKFYEKTPFPNYDNVDSVRALLQKAGRGLFARLLNEQIPFDARVGDIGCGTGQLTNFLAIAHRSVLGTDMCGNSLALAHQFAIKHGIDRAAFAQMNLFRPGLRDGFFDFVISNGVLHHTNDPRRAFARISRLAKPGGYVLVGLYHAYSRQLHYARRALFRLTGITSRVLDPHFGRVEAEGKREAWFQDQYCHPHESCHTLDEVFSWLEENNLEFVNAIPKPAGGPQLTPDERIFEPKDRGTVVSRVWSQLCSLSSGYREGGFFIVIGRRR
jgi:carbamoyltransferase